MNATAEAELKYPTKAENEYIAWPATIEYGGVIWNREDRKDGIQYRGFKDKLEMRVYQYPSGLWLWHAYFNNYIPEEVRPLGIDTDASAIVETREDAMFICLNALDGWLDGMQRILLLFGKDDPYAKGFRAGQEDIKAKIAEVVL